MRSPIRAKRYSYCRAKAEYRIVLWDEVVADGHEVVACALRWQVVWTVVEFLVNSSFVAIRLGRRNSERESKGLCGGYFRPGYMMKMQGGRWPFFFFALFHWSQPEV